MIEKLRRAPGRTAIGRALALFVAAGLLLCAVAGAAAVEGSVPIAARAADDDAEESLFSWINEERAQAGRPPLARNAALDELARLKAWDMANHGYFDHVSERLGTVFDMLQAAGIAFKWAGENIAKAPSAEAAHEGLMESPDHRANILSAGYTDVGIGVVRSGGKLYVCQIFAKPRGAAASS